MWKQKYWHTNYKRGCICPRIHLRNYLRRLKYLHSGIHNSLEPYRSCYHNPNEKQTITANWVQQIFSKIANLPAQWRRPRHLLESFWFCVKPQELTKGRNTLSQTCTISSTNKPNNNKSHRRYHHCLPSPLSMP